MPSKLVPIEDGTGGQNSKPRKIFAKKDLIEAVRKIAPNKPVVGWLLCATPRPEPNDSTDIYVTAMSTTAATTTMKPSTTFNKTSPVLSSPASACVISLHFYPPTQPPPRSRPPAAAAPRPACHPRCVPHRIQVKSNNTSMSRGASVPESNQLTIMETGVNLNARRYEASSCRLPLYSVMIVRFSPPPS